MTFLIGMGDGPIFRAVLRGVTIIPLFDSVATQVFGRFLVERLRKRECESVAVSVPGDRHIERFAGETNALEAAILQRARLPPGAADHVEMTVSRIERTAHRTRQKTSGQRDRGALRNAVHDVAEDA